MVQTTTDLTIPLLREMRGEMRDQRTPLLGVADGLRRMDRRMSELKDDLELMIRSEIMGRLANHETPFEAKFEALVERMSAIEAMR